MNYELFAAFTAATTVLILIPGPNIALIVANSIAHGPGPALVTVAGTSSAMVLQLGLTVAGMTSLMLVLAEWFEWLRWAGVAYLVYLGVRQWLAKPTAAASGAGLPVPRKTHYWQGFLVSAGNPKTLMFFAAFLPQFVDPALPPAPQLLALSITFLVIATLLDGSYALLAGRLRGRLTGRGAKLGNRISGTLLIGAGIGLALARRG